ncbi:DNA repair protein complementing XP-C cells homolog isoform X2 [Antedon mediterranea]
MATEDKKNKVIEITMDSPINTKKKKREELWEDYFRREINRHNKEQQIAVHKAHLLCLLALGRYRMRVCVTATLQALSMSVIPNKFTDTQNINVAFLVRFVRWFQSQFKISSTIEEESKQNFDEVLCSRFEDLEVASETEFVYIFASFLHHLHLNVRTIFSLQPISLKTENIIKKPNQKSPKDGELSKPSDKKQIKDKSTSKVIKTKNLKTKNKSRRQYASKVERSKDGSDCDMISDPESDEDWMEDKSTSKCPKSSATKRSKITASESKEGKEKKKVISVGTDVWVEVYLESLQKWVSIDCLRGVINHPEKCESYATQPVIYIMSFSTDGSIKDLTKKYASKWMTQTRKLRIDNIKPKWWLATLKPFKTENGDKNETEDQLLNANLLNKPMPTSVSEFKNHPLYALKRHLLKFEAIYPKTAEILGYCRGEAIYSRDCVHELHAKETWIKEARAVRIGEEPYKFVKARPKPHHKKTGETPPPVAVYGHWQTEKFMAPPAVDGKVPRNEHGNVELYKPEMLPPGTVHLQIPGLNKVARKLDIDCAQAMVGWDFHCGYSHPVFDGVVVCEEFQEILLDAWQKEQLETERKNDEKRELRALKNWRQLTKGLLIRERLNRRFQSSYEDIPPNQDESVSDVTMAFPLNRDMKHSKDSTHLFPFEKL